MNKQSLPFPAALNMAAALDALKMADAAMGVALDALQRIAIEEQPVGVSSFDVIGYREAVRLFIGLFAGAADGMRIHATAGKVREHIEQLEEDKRNPAGLERAALALCFAMASLEDVLDDLDAKDAGAAGDRLYGPLLAVVQLLGMIQERIESCTVRRCRGDFRNN